jgi:hypothetical protein
MSPLAGVQPVLNAPPATTSARAAAPSSRRAAARGGPGNGRGNDNGRGDDLSGEQDSVMEISLNDAWQY